MLRVKYRGVPILRHGLAIILRSKRRFFTRLSGVILLSFSIYSMQLDASWSLVKSPEATQYPGLKTACALWYQGLGSSIAAPVIVLEIILDHLLRL